MVILERRGLRESLESYAARWETTPDRARLAWRASGLRRLFADARWLVPYSVGPRIAPGLAVPTPKYPTEIEP